MPEPQVDNFEFYINAFSELSSCRQIGMGLGPIPFTAIAEYARIYKVDDISDFIYIIRVMDNAFLKGQNGNKTSRQEHNAQRPTNRK